jgi:hypothetical protein
MIARVVGVVPADVFVGQRVGVVFEDTGSGVTLPCFGAD